MKLFRVGRQVGLGILPPTLSIQKWRRWNVTLYKLFVTFLLLLLLFFLRLFRGRPRVSLECDD